jgi:subtilisin-like proprotein convertase family protein
MPLPVRPILSGGLLWLASVSAQATEYRGIADAGTYRAALMLSQSGTAAPRVALGADAAQPGPAVPTWTLRYDPTDGRLELLPAVAGATPRVDPYFGHQLRTAGLDPNLLRIGYAGDPAHGAPVLTLTTAGRTRAIDTRTLALDGGLMVVEAQLANGFELTVSLPRASAADALLDLQVGEAAVVHLMRTGAGGRIDRTDAALLCSTTGCDRQAAFVAPGGAIGLQVAAAQDASIRFEGWGNDCRGIAPYTAVLAAVGRQEYYCAARFSDTASRARAKGTVATTFSSSIPITIPDSGASDPDPATISVAAFGGRITDVNVRLNGVAHSNPDDLDVLLVSPADNTDPVILMSDVCGAQNIVDYDYAFDDEASTAMNDETVCQNVVNRPTNIGSGDTWPAPAPGLPHASTLAEFDGRNPIGTWRLFVTDDAAGDAGSIDSWSITLETAPYRFLIPGSGTAGIAGEYPSVRWVDEGVTEIFDVNLVIDDLSHTFPDDLDILLVSPQGTAVVVMSDACGSTDVNAFFWRIDDEADAPLSDQLANGCVPFDRQPVDYLPTDTWPAPAPAGPYAATMSAFDGEDPRGEWQLYVVDDGGGDGGFLITDWYLEISGERVFGDGFETP